MEWLDSIIGAIGGGLLSVAGSIVYFRPKLKEARAEAKKAETEASAAEYTHLLERISTMEEMYKRQGTEIDALRKELLDKGHENFELTRRLQNVEDENKNLREQVAALTDDIKAYKILLDKKP